MKYVKAELAQIRDKQTTSLHNGKLEKLCATMYKFSEALSPDKIQLCNVLFSCFWRKFALLLIASLDYFFVVFICKKKTVSMPRFLHLPTKRCSDCGAAGAWSRRGDSQVRWEHKGRRRSGQRIPVWAQWARSGAHPCSLGGLET